MIILGIETSCDETAASVVKDGREILSHIVASSAQMHIETGGIIPERAAREQVRSIIPVVEKALKEGCGWQNVIRKTQNVPPINAIAVTVGPGLVGSLLVGVETARTLAYVWQKPIVPVNHLAAHIYANWLVPELKTKNLKLKTKHSEPKFPAIALVVSGGHTDLVLLKDHAAPATPAAGAGGRGDMLWIGGTRDDAAGEAFDKTARILGLPYPGGPSIAAAAAKFQMRNDKFQIKLPRPMIDEDNFDFSFSGLKAAVAREVSKVSQVSPARDTTHSVAGGKVSKAIAYETQEAITDVLVAKTLRAIKEYGVNTLLLAGGVAANTRLKEKFEYSIRSQATLIQDTRYKIHLHIPPPWLCTDNASYIASYAYYNYKPVPWQEVSANPGSTITEV